ncbi:MAG: hypothetical protein Q9175_002101 [Cornicularia normoerica]
MIRTTGRAPSAADCTNMAKIQCSEVTLWPPPLQQGTVTMPWDLDRFYGKNANLPSKTTFSRLETRLIPSFSSRLFTLPLDILEYLLDRLKKRDAFRLSQTCKTFMWHPVVLKAIFHEPISTREIENWYDHLPDRVMNTKMMVGPPVTWGINASTGPFVRRITIPEWISLQDLDYLIAHCPNLHAVDFTEIFESLPYDVERPLEENLGSDSDYDIEFWPWVLDWCPALFRNLKSIHLPYGCWKTVYSRQHSYEQSQSVCLPILLHQADHLQSLEITCQQEPKRRPTPETRWETSAKLLTEILDNVSRGLTSLALYQSESTISNLDIFLQSLTVFPKLRTIKLSLHRDLEMYQRDTQPMYGFDSIIAPILSSSTKEYEHDTASVLEYLSIIKKISDRGRFSLVSSDCGEDYHSTPRDYYGLCHTELVHGPSVGFWTPVWTWNDCLNGVDGQNNPSVDTPDIGKCRALFEELTKARVLVSLELEPLNASRGAFFAGPWDRSVPHRCYDGSDDVGNILNGYPQSRSGGRAKILVTRHLERQPKQRFKQRSLLTTVTSKNPSPYYGMATGVNDQSPRRSPFDLATLEDRPSHGDHKNALVFRHLALAAWLSPKQETPQKKQRGSSDTVNAHSSISAAASNTLDVKTETPDPIWQLNKIGDLVDDLRLVWHEWFAYVYTITFAKHCDTNPEWHEWSKVIHKCKIHLRARLWREAEYTALLFRRIRVDFPRLTRFALYIPAALYVNHDQTFINNVLPGTGWTVNHYGSVGGSPPIPSLNTACLKLADDFCPFIRRIFTRPAPTDDPTAVIVHDDEWHVTKRPLFDLDGQYKSMEQLLTEPLWENYTTGED